MTQKLTTYRSKRNPEKTPEPMGAGATARRKAKKSAAPSFVIQEHHARALHWDFRLERDGVLVSWALPKGLPVDPTANHLAVHTEDHPIDYGGFEGDIPKGEYGGGHMSIWDDGTYDLIKWRDDEVMVDLHGTRARGRYVLFPTSGQKWMIHRMDPAAPDFEPMPSLIRPMLAAPAELTRSDNGWACEFKWDGVRAIVYVEGGRVRALTRNDKDLVASFPELRDIGEFLGSRSAILDGELVAFDERGRPNFGTLSHRLHVTGKSAIDRLAKESPVTFLAFDLLYIEGRSLTARPYDERRGLLEKLNLQGSSFATPPTVTDRSAADVIAIAKERGLEGIVMKRRTSPYSPGRRNNDWIKIKNFRTQEVVIGGWTDGKAGLVGNLGALLLGIPAAGGLAFVGKVGTGLSDRDRMKLRDQLMPLSQDSNPFSNRLSVADIRLAHFVRPDVVGEVQFSEWTRNGHLRHPSWRGLRPDKSSSEVTRES